MLSFDDLAPADSRKAAVVLVASDGEWLGRSLSSVLELHGYTVRLAAGGRATLATARRHPPDAIIIDEQLSEIGGLEVCQALRDDPLFDHATPLIMVTGAPTASRARSEAYTAGVWDYCSQPLNVGILVLKLNTFIRARSELSAQREKLLFDSATGLYSTNGFTHMAEVITARAIRNHEPIACLAIAPQPAGQSLSSAGDWPISIIASACRDASRRSDLLGHLGESRLGIIAPLTDAAGAYQLADRLKTGITRELRRSSATEPKLRAGIWASADLGVEITNPIELVRRAEAALTLALTGAAEIVNYDHVALN
ncbi:MAG: response regulator [Gemmatimonadaceae bacterium]